MAARASRNGRKLIVFLIAVGALYGLVALTADWKPKLGLDLQGGTRISLQAKTEEGGDPPASAMKEARSIIDQRVNGTGVAESEVSVQGGRNIVVEIPGKNETGIAEEISRSAQLYFRLVADVPVQYMAPPEEAPAPSPSPSPKPGKKDGTKNGTKDGTSPSGRAVSDGLLAADKKAAAPTPVAAAAVDDYMAWQADPGTKWLEAYQSYVCPEDSLDIVDNPGQPLIACDQDGRKYLLTKSVIDGKELSDASSGTPQSGIGFVVNLSFKSKAADVFADVTSAINAAYNQNGTQKAFAIVLDGEVLSAPTVSNGAITGGNAEISGDFTQTEAASLANSLKYGALPLKFEIGETSNEGPTLASNQLSAGLWAGGIGMAVVMLYCLLYYRGLGLVVVASLFGAAVITYAVVLLMSKAAGFTLTLPGIAGLIVAVGITADSFIVYFERIRDEMREGKSMRVAVETGWARARNTCLAADAVSLLAAVVLYIFAIGVVKGFAFALGISTVIDLVVFFWFTKPMVSWLATFKFFNTGHNWSGLSADHVGIERIGSARPAGGNA